MRKIFVGISALAIFSAAAIGWNLHHSVPPDEKLRIAGSRVVCAGKIGDTAGYYNAAIRYNRLARRLGKEEYPINSTYTAPPAYVAENVTFSSDCRFHS